VDAATIANIEHAEAIVRERWPQIAHEFIVTKGGYQGTADGDSASTHVKGGVADLAWCGHWQCVYALIEAGGFWWHRVAIPGRWNDHIHGGPRGFPAEHQDSLLHLQELAFLSGFDGLGQIPGSRDPQRRPDPLPDLVFPWPQEFTVNDQEADRIRKIVREEIDATTVPNPSNPDGKPWKLTRLLVDIWKRAGNR
jgi:hypothetical protein